MVKICLVTERYPPQSGGVSVAAARLVGLLREAGHHVHVFHPHVRDEGPRELVVSEDDGVTVSRLYYTEWDEDTVIAAYRSVVEMHRDQQFDVIHAFFLTMAHMAHFANHHPHAPSPPRWVIASARGSDALSRIFFPWWRDTIHEALSAPTTWLTSVNRYYVGHLETELGLDLSARSTTIYNGVSLIPKDQQWQLDPQNRGVVGTVGAFRRIKDLPLLIRAYGILPTTRRARLLLAGFFEPEDPEEEEWSRRLIDELGIGREVEETGRFPHSQVGQHLRRMHVYVQSSAYEGMPNALLEAASHGVPLVATDVGGMGEIIDDGETGLLVPHGDPGAMAVAIQRILDSDELARRLSEGALRLAQQYSRDNEAECWRRLYSHLLSHPPPPDRLPLSIPS